MPDYYPAPALIASASELLRKAGLDADKAQVVAEILVEGDLLGHTTHGLALLAPYLAALEAGTMTKTGSMQVIADFPAAVTWDGLRLPGPWLVTQAIELATVRARQQGTCTVVIRRSHHIGCLAAYLRPVTEQGLMIVLTCSDPTVKGVAPHGGRTEVITPNPIAAAWPTQGDPVIIDVSMSTSSLAFAKRRHAEGKKLPGVWLIDNQGQPTDDPAVLATTPPGSLLPIGGVDHGHKGYALGLLVEALTGGLAGHGRADVSPRWAATVCVQVFDPALFGGHDAFVRQTENIAASCRATPPRPGVDRVRLPGECGLRRRAAQLADGVELHPSILPGLAPWFEKLKVPAPASR
jgi:L-lactate dehydrogenase